MRLRELLVAITAVSTSVLSGPYFLGTSDFPSQHLQARNYVTDSSVASYDYIIAGGGLAGLVLAARLSADASTTVLVLEAGDSGDAVADRINPPAGAYYSSLLYTSYDWQYKTVPQPHVGSRNIDWPRGKVLGGSSAVNAMYLVRPSEIEIDAWENLISSEDEEAAKTWSWSQFYPAMKKSEAFIPPKLEVELGGNIKWDASSYGSSGAMQVSYPGFMMSQVGTWTSSLETLGLPTSTEPNGGKTLGGMISPSSINPTNWTRSYSKSAYLDPVLYRENLSVLVNSTVTRIIFADSPAGDLTATGVEFGHSANGTRKIIAVNREVILSGGVVGSPQILMLSGIGPKDVLEAAGVPLRVELPGVGQHLQDHLTAGVVWESTAETAGNIEESGSDFSKTPEFLSFINSATGWVNLTRLLGADGASAFQTTVANAVLASANNLVPSKYPEVIEGYKAIYSVIAEKILPSEVALVELLLGTNSPGVVSVQAAIQHPFSQGRLYINSSSAFDAPIIDPQYLSHPADLTILREGIKLVRLLGQTPPFNNSLPVETSPGPAVGTDEQVEQWLINQASTQYHPIATCAMLPKSQGGVVNAKLQVYGLANVRVVDSSVYPFAFAAHVGSSTYGLAEQASNLMIKVVDPIINVNNTARGLTVLPLRGLGWFILCVVIYVTGTFIV